MNCFCENSDCEYIKLFWEYARFKLLQVRNFIKNLKKYCYLTSGKEIFS